MNKHGWIQMNTHESNHARARITECSWVQLRACQCKWVCMCKWKWARVGMNKHSLCPHTMWGHKQGCKWGVMRGWMRGVNEAWTRMWGHEQHCKGMRVSMRVQMGVIRMWTRGRYKGKEGEWGSPGANESTNKAQMTMLLLHLTLAASWSCPCPYQHPSQILLDYFVFYSLF